MVILIQEYNKLRLRAIVNHGRKNSVKVSYVSNSGNLGTLRDTRRVSTNFIDLEAGDSADATSTTLIETNFRHMDLQYDSHFMMRMADSNLMKYPVFFDSAIDGQPEGIRAMTETDFYDTIIKPAIDIITTGNIGDSTQGIYYLKTTNTPTSTLINSSPVFTDTTADITKFNTKDSAGEFIEPLDQPRIEQNYYLHKIQSDSSISPGDRLVRPLLIGDISNHGTIQRSISSCFVHFFICTLLSILRGRCRERIYSKAKDIRCSSKVYCKSDGKDFWNLCTMSTSTSPTFSQNSRSR